MKRLLAALAVVLAVTGCSSMSESFVSPSTVTASPSAPPSVTHPASTAAWPAPIAKYTPGAVEVCTLPRPTSERKVTAATERAVVAAYRYVGKVGEYDHRVPFSLCGTNDARNIWPERADPGTVPKGFTLNSKDKLESYVAQKVHAHQANPAVGMTLAEGQRVFLGDWRVAYCMFLMPATYDACLREVQGK